MTEKKSLTTEYFEDVYAAKDDPWDFATSAYEAEKYAATLAALPREKYENAFEIGCSIGVLTEKLAPKCSRLLAVDVSKKALAQAAKRCEDLSNVEFKLMSVPREFPDTKFDLIVVSEVGYYLSKEDWQTLVGKTSARLAAEGQVTLVHWRPFVPDYPQTGDAIHDSFAAYANEKFRHMNSAPTEKYRLDVWEKL